MFCVTSSLPNCIHLFNAKNATPKQKSAFPHINLLFSFPIGAHNAIYILQASLH